MKFIITMALTSILSASVFAQTEAALVEAWKGFSTPEIFSSGFTHNLDELPLEGAIQIGPKAWSGSYWASQKGSINIRWNTERKEGFKYSSPSKAQVASMTQEELAKLSPSEKYDLLLGRYDYPTRRDASRAANPKAEDWAGICHGWAPAALHHNEPTPKVLTNPDGIRIPFGSADIKGLLSYYYAFYDDEHSGQMGLRCFFGEWMGGSKNCKNDLNAGAFHIVIANKLGIEKEGFLMDKDRFKEVWNQPVVGFKSQYLANLRRSGSAARNTVREIRVKTELYYINESEVDTWAPVMGTIEQRVEKMDLQYRIEIDSYGNIIGGEWESKDRPDFLWNRPKVKEFTGLFSLIPKLLND